MKKIIIFFIALFCISLFLFRTFLTTNFFQDDFFLLSISKVNTIDDFTRFFIPRSDVQFYRPLAAELLFYLLRTLFGWNAPLFHIAMFGIFFGTVGSFFILTMVFLSQKNMRYIATALFTLSAVHYNSFNWLANSSYILVTIFYLISLYVYVKKKNVLILILTYILGLRTNELIITLPAVLIVYSLLLEKKNIAKQIPIIACIVCITLLYLDFRFILFPPHFGEYQYVINASIISSYRWYVLFFLNWPETIKDYMLTFYKIRPDFVSTFKTETLSFIANSLAVIIGLIVIPLILIIKKRKLKHFIVAKGQTIAFLSIFCLIAVLPIVFIPSHVSPQQGTIALCGWLIVLCIPLDFVYKQKYMRLNALLIVVLAFWVFSTAQNIDFNNQTYWIKRRSEIATEWLKKISDKKEKILPHSIVVIGDNQKETEIALFYDVGVKEYLNKPDIFVEYSDDKNIKGTVQVVNYILR